MGDSSQTGSVASSMVLVKTVSVEILKQVELFKC